MGDLGECCTPQLIFQLRVPLVGNQQSRIGLDEDILVNELYQRGATATSGKRHFRRYLARVNLIRECSFVHRNQLSGSLFSMRVSFSHICLMFI